MPCSFNEGLHSHGAGSGLGKQVRGGDGWGMAFEYLKGEFVLATIKSLLRICIKHLLHPKDKLHPQCTVFSLL
jgi:hypothetical protein